VETLFSQKGIIALLGEKGDLKELIGEAQQWRKEKVRSGGLSLGVNALQIRRGCLYRTT
jgi:hypothetical protein